MEGARSLRNVGKLLQGCLAPYPTRQFSLELRNVLGGSPMGLAPPWFFSWGGGYSYKHMFSPFENFFLITLEHLGQQDN
jgi:hypothetical protein